MNTVGKSPSPSVMNNRALHQKQISAFRRKIRAFYKKNRRDLPFRNSSDPYEITVSEIMLQQTQVDRVLPYYRRWIERWPSWDQLASASRKEILSQWSGLGYNRRAIYLQQIAKQLVADFDSALPSSEELLLTLPGIGEYTARAILVFAFNQHLPFVETNIRKVLIHELDLERETSKAELLEIAEQVLPSRDARNWHYALMDYGALGLPKTSNRVAPLTKQSRFEGSNRQIRGEIIRQLTSKKSVGIQVISKTLERSLNDVTKAVDSLEHEGMISVRNDRLYLNT